MDRTIHFGHLWTTAGISLYIPGPSSATITMMRHVAICNLPEPFARPSLPRHPQMSDPPASISVELAARSHAVFQTKKHCASVWGCAVFRSLSLSLSLSLFVPSPDPSPSLLVFVKGVIFQVIWIVILLPNRFKGCTLWLWGRKQSAVHLLLLWWKLCSCPILMF